MKVWKFPAVVVGIILLLVIGAGCIPANMAFVSEKESEGVERWVCGDYIEGCSLFSTDCLRFVGNVANGTGELRVGNVLEYTKFGYEGIERRWDWCIRSDNFYDCTFMISVDGVGKYWHRGGSGGIERPTDVFKCSKM